MTLDNYDIVMFMFSEPFSVIGDGDEESEEEREAWLPNTMQHASDIPICH